MKKKISTFVGAALLVTICLLSFSGESKTMTCKLQSVSEDGYYGYYLCEDGTWRTVLRGVVVIG